MIQTLNFFFNIYFKIIINQILYHHDQNLYFKTAKRNDYTIKILNNNNDKCHKIHRKLCIYKCIGNNDKNLEMMTVNVLF